MKQSCHVPTPAKRQVSDILQRAEHAMMVAVHKALEDARNKTAEEMQSIGSHQRPPAYEYFAKLVHHHMFCLLCGADPETMEGGDAEIAALVLDNGRKISVHYWAGGNTGPSPTNSAG